ncbi:hypothetical protein J0895_16865 [Phormidium pseudopriestleyi FRX01]|uniref:Uncharacterized protein n=1 Tax=Phormidium pseudopriestleyi FRX01 TaxID=1759528 RepID=A0ABS3FUC2_9CYAN|nr:hypothetical protein [Phormidium pseudopriestleyi]MBO0350733.1 hypothetical protein [Phormidium pseudopriestleyi FRX01]
MDPLDAIAPELPSFVSYLFTGKTSAKLCTNHALEEENFTQIGMMALPNP